MRKYIDTIKGYTSKLKDTLEYFNYIEELSRKEGAIDFDVVDKEKLISNFSIAKNSLFKIPSRYDHILLKSLYLNLFSIFDQFIGDYLYSIYKMRPELIDKSNKQYSASEVCQFNSIDDFKNSIIEKEIDSHRRESYVKQFELLENKFDMKLTKFKNWSKFVEVTQRRNVVMHCGGVVSEQYLMICNENGCNLSVKKNECISIDENYLKESIYILLEVGIKLVHTTWRKFNTNNEKLEKSDRALNNVVFNLLVEKEYKLAIEICEFAYSQKRFSSDEFKLMFLVNLGIALKKENEKAKLKKLLAGYDTSVVKLEYKLAINILSDQYDDIKKIIVNIGNKSDLYSKNAYATWPIFDFVRDRADFREAFYQVYNTTIEKYLEEIISTYSVIEESISEIESIEASISKQL